MIYSWLHFLLVSYALLIFLAWARLPEYHHGKRRISELLKSIETKMIEYRYQATNPYRGMNIKHLLNDHYLFNINSIDLIAFGQEDLESTVPMSTIFHLLAHNFFSSTKLPLLFKLLTPVQSALCFLFPAF